MTRFSVLLSVFLLVFGLSATATADSNPDVWVIHGIPGQDAGSKDPLLPVDVAVNKKCVLAGFKFRQIAGPLSLPPGDYTIEISLANKEKPCSNPAIITAKVKLGADDNVAIIANLDAAGKPTANKFDLDLSRPSAWKSRLILHHTAAAPAVDVGLKRYGFWFPKSLEFKNVKNGAQADVDVLLGLWRLSIAPAGSKTPVLGPVYGIIPPGFVFSIFVVGSVKNETLTLILLPLKPEKNRGR
jgi:hypothetical protein